MAKRGTTLSSKKGKSKKSPKTNKRLEIKRVMVIKKLARKARRA